MSPYVRKVPTASGAKAVQIIWSKKRGHAEVEHIGSAHDEAQLELLMAVARLERSLPDIDQLVTLGAGFDTRPYRLPRDTSLRSFEVDLPATQKVKRRVHDEAGVDTRGVTFVPADFEKDDWLAELIDAGFDMQRPALFVWEGVIICLDQAAVEDTLRKVARCAKGTLIAFDYYSSLAVDSSEPYWRFARAATQRAGEPIKFGVDATPPLAERVAELLAACGLTLREQRTLGDESGSRRAWGGFTVAVVESSPNPLRANLARPEPSPCHSLLRICNHRNRGRTACRRCRPDEEGPGIGFWPAFLRRLRQPRS